MYIWMPLQSTLMVLHSPLVSSWPLPLPLPNPLHLVPDHDYCCYKSYKENNIISHIPLLQRVLTLNVFKKLPKPPQVINSFMAQITCHATTKVGDTRSDGMEEVRVVVVHLRVEEGVTVTLVALELFMAAGLGQWG